MSMKPGTVAQPAKSLTEAIEHALKMEWLAVHGESLPETGAEDRRLLLAAIAQGLLDYLKDHQTGFQIRYDGINDDEQVPYVKIEIQAPELTLSPNSGGESTELTASGKFFGSGKTVTVSWDDDDPQTTLLTVTVGADDQFSGTGSVPGGADPGEHVVAARDNDGHVALAVFTVSE